MRKFLFPRAIGSVSLQGCCRPVSERGFRTAHSIRGFGLHGRHTRRAHARRALRRAQHGCLIGKYVICGSMFGEGERYAVYCRCGERPPHSKLLGTGGEERMGKGTAHHPKRRRRVKFPIRKGKPARREGASHHGRSGRMARSEKEKKPLGNDDRCRMNSQSEKGSTRRR